MRSLTLQQLKNLPMTDKLMFHFSARQSWSRPVNGVSDFPLSLNGYFAACRHHKHTWTSSSNDAVLSEWSRLCLSHDLNALLET